MTWRSGDGIDWRHSHSQWTGTVAALGPGFRMQRTVGEFRYGYPEAPHWDGRLRRGWARGPGRWRRWLRFEPHRWSAR
jgi:hypothetical protein